jgi:hypothetical protein
MSNEAVDIKQDQEHILTVGELINLLSALPMDAKVSHEGCDCYGEAKSVEYDERSNTVLITRNE